MQIETVTNIMLVFFITSLTCHRYIFINVISTIYILIPVRIILLTGDKKEEKCH
jgi:hypothetical protein